MEIDEPAGDGCCGPKPPQQKIPAEAGHPLGGEEVKKNGGIVDFE